MKTIEEIRHGNLHLLASRGHSQADIGRAIDVDRRQVNQWFVSPPLRNLSSENARAIEAKFALERGALDHEGLSDGGSQLARLDRRILASALDSAVRMKGGPTAELVADVYEHLMDEARQATVTDLSSRSPKEPASHGVVVGSDQGAGENPQSKGRRRSK